MIKTTVETKEDTKPEKRIACPICGLPLFFANNADLQIRCTRCKQYIKVEVMNEGAPIE